MMIGRWEVTFLFADEKYDEEEVLSCLYDSEASYDTMLDAYHIMEDNEPNHGFTYSNPVFLKALVVVGPATSGEEFIDTFVHEILHLAMEIAVSEDVDLRGERPAYIAGDTARDLSRVICELGCVPHGKLSSSVRERN